MKIAVLLHIVLFHLLFTAIFFILLEYSTVLHLEVEKGVVRLPKSENAFFAELKAHGCSSKFAAGTLSRKSKFPVELQQIIHYSYPGLAHGRPLNKVMVVLFGQSGAGKSSTINALFNDHVCETSSTTSQTHTVTEYGKELCVIDSNAASVIGTLSFVDPPGALDVDQTKEATNFVIINKFRHENSDLRSRKPVLKASSVIREHVYPNMVLMVIHGGDNRMEGPDSNLQKTLTALEKYQLIDRLYPNLVVVVTHAMTIPPKCYARETTLIKHVIQEAAYNVLRLRKVQVVFVENKPESYNMEKPEGYDFYRLPDGRLSHYNLIRAMEKQFDETGDDLGKLLCGWYFADDCPEKKIKANVLNSVEDDTLTPEETEEALQMLASIDTHLSTEDVAPSKFDFQILGHGYCPKTESLKKITVYSEDNPIRAKLGNTVYSVPECFQFEDVCDDHFLQISYATKSNYEIRKISSYRLDPSKLVVHAHPKARWVKERSFNQISITRAVYEKRLVFASISDPESNVNEEILEILNNLPASYNEYNVECFKEFFKRYGSHFIHEISIGGYVTIDNQVRTATHTESQGLEMHKKLRTVFQRVINLEKGENEYVSSPEGSDDKDFQKSTLSFDGGDPPQVTTLADFTAVRYADWVETVKRFPVELQYSFKLLPYYILVKNDRRRLALSHATVQYLDGTMPLPCSPSTPTKRNGIFFEDSGPEAVFVEEELKRYKAEEEQSQPLQLRRKDVGIQMVQSAQTAVKERYMKCVIL